MDTFFAILIPTFRRKTGSYHLVHRCLTQIKKQTFPFWKVFLIGDHYVPEKEFVELSKIIPQDSIYSENLEFSRERLKYSGKEMWRVSGHTPLCKGYEQILKEKIPVIALCNDDDWWYENHLKTLFEGFKKNTSFVYTKSTHVKGHLPKKIDNLPSPCNLACSAAAWRIKDIPLFFRDINEERSNQPANDADLWDRIRKYCIDHKLKSVYIPTLTVRHDSEEQIDERLEPSIL